MSRSVIHTLKSQLKKIQQRKGLGKRQIIVLFPGDVCPAHDKSAIIITVVYDESVEQEFQERELTGFYDPKKLN